MASEDKDYYNKSEVLALIEQAKRDAVEELKRQMNIIIDENHSDLSYKETM